MANLDDPRRAIRLLDAFARMARNDDHHWGYLGDDWPDDDAVIRDLELAQRAVRAEHHIPAPVRRRATVHLTAAPEPTQWEVRVQSDELAWDFLIGIARSDAATEEDALNLAGELVKQGVTAMGGQAAEAR